MLRVGSPVAGHIRAVSEIPDPVFAKGLVGPGLAVCPVRVPQKAVAPVSGVLAKLHPHAFLVVSDSGNGVLVHLGIDTVHLQGRGFELLAREGEHVEAGDEIVAWDPRAVEEAGRSAVCAVVVLDCDPADVRRQQLHVDVDRGELLFEVNC
jgi:sugar PTS system EIIA component